MVRAERLGENRGLIGRLYGPAPNAKRVDALSNATFEVMTGASLGVAMIGQTLAQVGAGDPTRGQTGGPIDEHARIDLWDSFARWVPKQAGSRSEVLVALDWTDFNHGGQLTLLLSVVTGYGRAAR